MEAKSRNRVMGVLFLGVLMGALDIAIVGPALPALRNAFKLDDRTLAWIFTIYVLFNLLGAPLMARLSDRYGRKTIYLLNIGLFAIGSLIVALSPHIAVLLIGRSLQGLSAGGIFPVASAVVGDIFPAEERGRALGLIGAVFGIAFIFGPILGGVLVGFGWQWLFLINIPIALIVAWMGMQSLPANTPTANKQPFDVAGLALLTLVLSGLTIGISQFNSSAPLASLLSLQVWPFLALMVVSAPFFWWAEQRAADPLVRPSLLSTRQLLLVNGLSAGAGLGEAVLVFLPSLALAAAFVSTPRSASFLILPVVIAMAVGSPLAGRILDRIGAKPVVIMGASLLTLGMLVLSAWGTHFWVFIGGCLVIGLGLSSLLGAPLRYIMLQEAPSEERAAAQGMITVATGVGQLVGGALVGAVAASGGGGVAGYMLGYFATGMVGVVLVFASLGLRRDGPAVSTEVTPSAAH